MVTPLEQLTQRGGIIPHAAQISPRNVISLGGLMPTCGICCAKLSGSTFSSFPFPNTLYTSPSTFQWNTWPIISLKPSCLKASKGRRGVGETYLFYLFQSPVILFDGLVSRGGGERKLVISEKLTNSIFLCFCGNDPLDISYHATWRETQCSLHVTYYFSIFHCFCIYYYICT